MKKKNSGWRQLPPWHKQHTIKQWFPKLGAPHQVGQQIHFNIFFICSSGEIAICNKVQCKVIVWRGGRLDSILICKKVALQNKIGIHWQTVLLLRIIWWSVMSLKLPFIKTTFLESFENLVCDKVLRWLVRPNRN